MAERGARYLVLLSRSGACTEEQIEVIANLRALGVEVMTPCCDISDYDALKEVIKEVYHTMPPIKGCVQSAMALRVSQIFAPGAYCLLLINRYFRIRYFVT